MQCTKLEPSEEPPDVPTTKSYKKAFCFETIVMNHEAISKGKGTGSVASRSAVTQLVTSCIELADRIRPAGSIFSELHVPMYPVSQLLRGGFPRGRSGHVPPAASQRRRALFGSPASQPAQLPPPNLGFFSQPSSAPVRRATDPRQQIPPTPSRISHLPLILPPVNPHLHRPPRALIGCLSMSIASGRVSF